MSKPVKDENEMSNMVSIKGHANAAYEFSHAGWETDILTGDNTGHSYLSTKYYYRISSTTDRDPTSPTKSV